MLRGTVVESALGRDLVLVPVTDCLVTYSSSPLLHVVVERAKLDKVSISKDSSTSNIYRSVLLYLINKVYFLLRRRKYLYPYRESKP